jgi:hypothetical protein
MAVMAMKIGAIHFARLRAAAIRTTAANGSRNHPSKRVSVAARAIPPAPTTEITDRLCWNWTKK